MECWQAYPRFSKETVLIHTGLYIYIDEILAIGVYMADLRTPWTKTVEKMRIQLKMLQNQPLHIKLCFF